LRLGSFSLLLDFGFEEWLLGFVPFEQINKCTVVVFLFSASCVRGVTDYLLSSQFQLLYLTRRVLAFGVGVLATAGRQKARLLLVLVRDSIGLLLEGVIPTVGGLVGRGATEDVDLIVEQRRHLITKLLKERGVCIMSRARARIKKKTANSTDMCAHEVDTGKRASTSHKLYYHS